MRLVPRRKRWWVLIGLAVSLGIGWWVLTRPTELERKLERVRVGMSREEVVALLGKPNEPIVWGGLWQRRAEYCIVIFGEDGHVTEKEYTRLTVVELLREWWSQKSGTAAPF